MIDVDPGLDAKLQAFFEHIEASIPPAGLTDIDTSVPARTRRTFNLFAGLAAATVIAGSVAVFALELRSHNTPGPGPAATSASPSARPSASPSALKKMPLLGSAGIPASAHEVMPLTRGQGSVLLQTFVPQGTLYIQFDCAGPGPFKFLSTDHVIGNGQLQCSSDIGVTTITVGSPKVYDDKPLTLQVTADGSMTWEIYIAESRPPLPELTVEPDQRVLVPVTYGTGSITLPTFSVGPDEWLDVREACNSGSSADAIEMVGNTYFGDDAQYGCSGADGSFGGGGSGPPGPGGSGPISVRVITAPAISWEILITEGPTALRTTVFWRRRGGSCGVRHGFRRLAYVHFRPALVDRRRLLGGRHADHRVVHLHADGDAGLRRAGPNTSRHRRGSRAAGVAVGRRAIVDGLGDLHLPGRAAKQPRGMPRVSSGGSTPTPCVQTGG